VPRPRKFESDALRQRAYRRRKRKALPPDLPRAASVATMPSLARWKTLLSKAELLLETAKDEMGGYFDERSESWQESERGEAFQERIQNLETAVEALRDAL